MWAMATFTRASALIPTTQTKWRAVPGSHARWPKTALRLGGTVSGEHGIGIGKQKYMAAEHGPALDWMRRIKTVV